MSHRKPMKSGEAGFSRGVIWALMSLYKSYGLIDSDYRAIAGGANFDHLIRIARRDGDMKASGLSEYIKTCDPKCPVK